MRLETKWQKALNRLQGKEFQERYKSLAAMELDLNVVVGWFTKQFGCELVVSITDITNGYPDDDDEDVDGE